MPLVWPNIRENKTTKSKTKLSLSIALVTLEALLTGQMTNEKIEHPSKIETDDCHWFRG